MFDTIKLLFLKLFWILAIFILIVAFVFFNQVSDESEIEDEIDDSFLEKRYK